MPKTRRLDSDDDDENNTQTSQPQTKRRKTTRSTSQTFEQSQPTRRRRRGASPPPSEDEIVFSPPRNGRAKRTLSMSQPDEDDPLSDDQNYTQSQSQSQSQTQTQTQTTTTSRLLDTSMTPDIIRYILFKDGAHQFVDTAKMKQELGIKGTAHAALKDIKSKLAELGLEIVPIETGAAKSKTLPTLAELAQLQEQSQEFSQTQSLREAAKLPAKFVLKNTVNSDVFAKYHHFMQTKHENEMNGVLACVLCIIYCSEDQRIARPELEQSLLELDSAIEENVWPLKDIVRKLETQGWISRSKDLVEQEGNKIEFVEFGPRAVVTLTEDIMSNLVSLCMQGTQDNDNATSSQL